MGIRSTALSLTAAATVAAAGITGAALAAKEPPAVRTVTATGSKLRFSASKLRAPAGRVQLKLLNKADLSHDIAIKGKNLAHPVKGKVVPKGRTSTVTVRLAPGTYRFYCSVFGHLKGGMKGTLTVTG